MERKNILSIVIMGFLTAVALVLLTAHIVPAQQNRRIIRKEERRVALVIGNGAYKSSPLRNPVNDANDMAEALEKCGFTVTKRVNVTRSQLRDSVRSFGDQIKRGGVGLFFYAGHGIQVEGENYLIPVGADVRRKYDVEDQCLKVSYVLGAMEEAKNRLNIIILDACRDNPFRGYRSKNQGLAMMKAPSGSYLAYATRPGSVSSDGPGRNGLFTSKLLKHISTPGLRLVDLFMKVRNEVKAASDSGQEPWDNHSLTAKFYFVPGSQEGSAVVERPQERPTGSTPLAEERARLEAERKRLAEEKRVFEEERRLTAERKRLAKEKAKLEAERKSIEAEKEKLASIPRQKYHLAPGIIYDSQTGLDWYVHPETKMTWNEARDWVKSLTVGGGGWRMPSSTELKGLYNKGVGRQNTALAFKSKIYWVWSGETKGSSLVWIFAFHYGYGEWSDYNNTWAQAFAVRSRR